MALQASYGLAPISGQNYIVNNVATLNVLDDFDSSLADGTPILATAAGANRINQIWTYLTYPASDGSTVFTLQALSTSQAESLYLDRGGYLRVDTSTGQVVQGGAPQAWKLVQVNATVFQIVPWETVISMGGTLLLTDSNPATDGNDPLANQVALEADVKSAEQNWFFTNP